MTDLTKPENDEALERLKEEMNYCPEVDFKKIATEVFGPPIERHEMDSDQSKSSWWHGFLFWR